jgi:hypothetical protein
MALDSTFILVSESHGARGHILLSRIDGYFGVRKSRESNLRDREREGNAFVQKASVPVPRTCLADVVGRLRLFYKY